MNDTAYQESLDYLYSFIDFSLTRNLRYAEEKFDLSRMNLLMNLLGNPQNHYDVIHVAGTKGKGSTCAIISSILTAQGYKVGFYSSPHMIDFRERIRINSRKIKTDEFVQQLDKMRKAIDKVKNISTFEISTALAFKYFLDKDVDIAVIEVGMGGRLDATNVVNPVLSVITSISLDHTKILGETISEIAREKAGIIKPVIPVVIGKQENGAKEVLLDAAKENTSLVIDVADEYDWEQKTFSLEGQVFTVSRCNKNEQGENYGPFSLKLLGDHQIDNALNALAVMENLPDKYQVSRESLIKGFSEARWPGRFEVLERNPLVIVDGAHNPDSFNKLAKTIEKYLNGKQVTLIFGASEDKNIAEMIKIITPYVDSIVFSKSDHPRAMTEGEIKVKIEDFYIEPFEFWDIDVLTRKILDEKRNHAFVASGSIFIAGAVKQIWQTYKENFKNSKNL